MIQRILTNPKVKEIGLILLTPFLIIFSYGLVGGILNWALEYRWLFPFVTIPLIGMSVYSGLLDLKSPAANPIRKGLAIFSIMILTAALGFGAISLWLATVGWADYAPEDLGLFRYSNYYLWLFFDMIPLLKVNDTLGLVAPLQPVGFVAGLPVLVFRVLVAYVLLKHLKAWWSRRTEKDENRAKSRSTVQ